MTGPEQNQASKSKSGSKRGFLRKKFVRRTAIGAGAFVVAVIAIVIVVGTGPVLRLATPFVNQTVSDATDSNFAIGRIEGSLWTSLSFDKLVMDRPADGLHVQLQGAEFDWSPLALLGGRLQVNRLALASSTIALPDGSLPADEAEIDEDEETSGGFVLPLDIGLDELSLREIAVMAPTSEQTFLYELSGTASIGRNMSAKLGLDLTPLDGGADRLHVDLDFDGPAQRLVADIEGALDREGIVMTLAGMGPDQVTDISLSLRGQGPASDWRGQLDLRAVDYAALAGTVGIGLDHDQVGFEFDGDLESFDKIAAQLPEPLRQNVALGLGGMFDSGENHLSFDRLSVAMPDALDLSGTAELDLAESLISGDISTNLDPALSQLADDAVNWAGLTARAQVSGDLALPTVALDVTARNFTTPVSRIASLNARADFKDFQVLTINVGTKGSDWNDPGLAAFLGADQEISLAAQIEPDFSAAEIRHLVVTVPDMVVTGQADLGFGQEIMVTDGRLIGDVKKLAIFGPISGLDLSGAAQLGITEINWASQSGGKATLDLEGTETGFGLSDLDRIVGAKPHLAGDVTIAPNMDVALDLSTIDVETIGGEIYVDLRDSFSSLKVQGDLNVGPETVPPGIGVSIAPAVVDIDLDGDITAPPGTVKISIPKVTASGQELENVNLTTTLQWSDDAVLRVDNRGQFDTKDQTYQLAAQLNLPADGLHVRNIAFKGDGLLLEGDISLPGYSTPMTGDIVLSNLDASALANFGSPVVSGTAQAAVNLSARNGGQGVDINASALGFRMESPSGDDPVRLEDIRIQASIENALSDPEITANLTGKEIVANPVEVAEVTLDVTGNPGAFDVTVAGNGTYDGNVPFEIDSTANIALANGVAVSANQLDAVISDQTIALQQPLVFSQKPNGERKLDGELTIGSGQLTATLAQQPNQQSISADVALKSLDLGPWGRIAGLEGLSGMANLTASLREEAGSPPAIKVDGDITNITAKAVKDIKPFEMNLDVNLADGSLSGDVLLGNEDVKILSATGTMPLAISVLKQDFNPALDVPVAGKVRLNGEIAEFWPYVPAPDHVLSGEINLALDVDGTLDDIRWNGNVSLADGRYEHLEYGTLFEQIALNGTFDQNGLSIPDISATDGGQGTVDGAINMEMRDGGDLAYDVNIDLRNTALTRKDELRFWADVTTSVTGTQSSADIESTVTLRRGEVDLTLALPESVPTIEVANLPSTHKEPAKESNADEDADEDNGFSGNLNVTVDVPGRLFVRGKGLDSEWGGRLEVTGTTDAPKIAGQLSALRGQLSVIGKTFVIENSKITFSGAVPPDPLLNIAGVYTTDDLEVTASFQGPASDPELVLSSSPSLPEDEILSQVLFGKSQGSLNAVEAVQLASALNELSGGGSGLDLVGALRQFIGVDVLRVGGGDDGPNVRVGKYLTEGIYVGTKAGTTPGSSGVEVEIELTPNISVTSESTEIDSKAGVKYRLDY
ncbi:translocation/assembly module TamB domain-containing protein [Thalassospira sp. MA62]|nr:translocation/assembly module TamB domain-containing protein [Thalassospira sp. MA62]